MPSASRSTSDLKGDLLSVKMFGAVGDGVTDDRNAFQKGLDYLGGKGGGYLYVPKVNNGFYYLGSGITIPSNVILKGEGDGSLLFRGGTLADGTALINIGGENAGIEAIKIDGNVTTITNLRYGAGTSSVLFNNDPMDSKLTLNSSIWIAPGSHNFWISEVTIVHTGGYSILVDVRDADTRNGVIQNCFFENCRPHLFGTDATPSNNIYGAWTGGVFIKGDCRASESKLFAMRGLRISGCIFHRMNGNCIWSHSSGFDTQHENFDLINNVFRYIARDGYMIGNVQGGRAHGSMKYVGFTHTTDNDTPVGAYLTDHYAVGFDAAGYVSGFEFSGDVNEFYGGACDLDGVRNSAVRITAHSTQSIAKGIQTGDTSGNGGGRNVLITDCFLSGCNAGAIVLNQAEACICENNVIRHPTGAAVAPVLLYSTDKRTKENIVRGNTIYWPDAGFSIAESDGGSGTGFDSSTVNYVYGNHCYGGTVGEFLKDVNSGSITGQFLSTNSSSATSRSESFVQREGFGSTAALKIKKRLGSTVTQLAQFQDTNGWLNVSDGSAGTGGLATGNRTAAAFNDLLFTGKGLFDSLCALYDYGGAGTYSDTDADSLTNDWALLRFDKANTRIQVSLTTSGGNRVWTTLGGGGSPGGSDTHVQFNDGGVFAGEAALVWNKTTDRLTVTGSVEIINNAGSDALVLSRTSATARDWGIGINSSGELLLNDATASATRMKVTTAGVFQFGGTNVQIDQSGNISATAVISSTGGSGGVNVPAATATNAIQAPNGGVTAKWLITTESVFGIGVATPPVSSSGQGKIHFNSSSNKWQYSEDGSSWANCFGAGSVAGGDREVQFNNSGSFGAVNLFKYNSGGAVQIGSASDDGSGAKLQVTGFVRATVGFASPGTAADTINIPDGGVTAKSLISIRDDADSGLVLKRAAATAREYGLNVNGSGFLVLRDRSGSADRLTVNTSGQVTIGSTVAIDQSGNITMSGVLNCNGASGGVNVSSNSAYNCIQASNNGGMAARSFTASVYIQAGQSSGVPSATTSDSLNNGCLYYDTSTNKLRVRISGSFTDVLTGSSAGVTSLNSLTGALSIAAGTGISVSASGSTITISNSGVTSVSGGTGVSVSGSGAVTVSIGQAVSTSSDVTFASVTTGSGGVLQSGATGTSIAFQTTNFNFQVNGNGVVSCQQLNIAGNTCIDSSRNGTFNRVTVQATSASTPPSGLHFYLNGSQLRVRWASGTDQEVSLI